MPSFGKISWTVFEESPENLIFHTILPRLSKKEDFLHEIQLHQMTSIINTWLHAKFQKDLMTGFREKSRKPHFIPIFGTFASFTQKPDFLQEIRLRHILAIIEF